MREEREGNRESDCVINESTRLLPFNMMNQYYSRIARDRIPTAVLESSLTLELQPEDVLAYKDLLAYIAAIGGLSNHDLLMLRGTSTALKATVDRIPLKLIEPNSVHKITYNNIFTLFHSSEPAEIALTFERILYGKKKCRHEAEECAVIGVTSTAGVGAFVSLVACVLLEINAPHIQSVHAFYALLGFMGCGAVSLPFLTRRIGIPMPESQLPDETDGMMAARAVRGLLTR